MTTPYIPDHVRNSRSDHLYHVRESLLLVMKRLLPQLYLSRDAYNTVAMCSDNVKLIDAELHIRMMRQPKPFRQSWKPQFDGKKRSR